MNTEKTIKLKYERIFCVIENCTWDMYLALKKIEQQEINNINAEAT